MKDPLEKGISITRRHELKYLCPVRQLELIKRRLLSVMKPDKHQGTDGYTIRSLYFDTLSDRFFEENNAGIEYRNKYRIRLYNLDTNYIRFEEKSTVGNLKSKRSAKLTREDVEHIITVGVNIEDTDNEVLKRIGVLQKTELLRPKVIVEYDRFAFVSRIGNVRITFDQCIRASKDIEYFFEDIPTIPILPDQISLMEVKYDGILPGYITSLMNIGDLQQISFSKYALCRNIINNNGRIEDTYELSECYG